MRSYVCAAQTLQKHEDSSLLLGVLFFLPTETQLEELGQDRNSQEKRGITKECD